MNSLKGILGLSTRQAKPVKYEDTQPSLEIRLSPPRHPLPEVSGKIEVVDFSRRKVEERMTTKLLKSYDEEINRGRKLITSLIREALAAFDDPLVVPSSFFALPNARWRTGKVWVSVEAPTPIDGAVLKRIEAIEEKNAKMEVLEFKGLIEDMHEVTRYTLQQLNETLINTMRPVIQTKGSGYGSFIALDAGNQRCMELQRKFGDELVQCDIGYNATTESVHEHQITSFADEHSYPTVESLVRDMLERREVDEDLYRARSLSLMARLAQEESRIIAELLQAAVATISVKYGDAIRATNMTREELKLYNMMHPKNMNNINPVFGLQPRMR